MLRHFRSKYLPNSRFKQKPVSMVSVECWSSTNRDHFQAFHSFKDAINDAFLATSPKFTTNVRYSRWNYGYLISNRGSKTERISMGNQRNTPLEQWLSELQKNNRFRPTLRRKITLKNWYTGSVYIIIVGAMRMTAIPCAITANTVAANSETTFKNVSCITVHFELKIV